MSAPAVTATCAWGNHDAPATTTTPNGVAICADCVPLSGLDASRARHAAYLATQAQDMHCRTCGTDNAVRECKDWCPRMQGACDCGSTLCGHCQRGLGTTLASMGHR